MICEKYIKTNRIDLQHLCLGNHFVNLWTKFSFILSSYMSILLWKKNGFKERRYKALICYCKNDYGNKAKTGSIGNHRSRLSLKKKIIKIFNFINNIYI